MKMTIESTSKIVLLNNVPTRIWEGETENGIKVHCYVARVAVDEKEPRLGEFESDLKTCKVPSPEIQEIPMSLIL